MSRAKAVKRPKLALVHSVPESLSEIEERLELTKGIRRLSSRALDGELKSIAIVVQTRDGGFESVLLGEFKNDAQAAHYAVSRLAASLLWPDEV